MKIRILAAAGALLCATGAQASRIYTWQTDTVWLGAQWHQYCRPTTSGDDTEYSCDWRAVQPSNITGLLQVSDSITDVSARYFQRAASGLETGLERFEFAVSRAYKVGFDVFLVTSR